MTREVCFPPCWGMTMKLDLMQGDCLERMKEIPDGSVDAVICDPPYQITACAWDSIIPLEPMWEQLNRVIKPNGAIVMMASEPFTSLLICSNIGEFKYRVVWKKNKATGFLNAKKQPLRCIEDICVFYKSQPTYNPQKTTGHKPVNSFTKHTSDGDTVGKTKTGISGGGQTDRYPTNFVDFKVVNNDGSSEEGKKVHPTQKPVALMEYLIKTYTNEGETVLDFAAGSFTTGVACVNTNRNGIMIEKDPHYFKIGSERVERALSEKGG